MSTSALALDSPSASVRVKGVDGILLENVNAYLSPLVERGLGDTQADRARIEKAVLLGMRALGHYRPGVEIKKSADFLNKPVFEVRITPDEPVHIADISINISGEAGNDRDFRRLLDTVPEKGDRLNHGLYDDFKRTLSGLGAEKGFFDAEFTRSELGVSLARHSAYWNIDWSSGKRYRFGDVTFKGSQIEEKYLESLIPFEKGDAYTGEALGSLTRHLSDTGWFESVLVVPDFDAARNDTGKELPLEATLIPRKANSIETGLGYATDIGPRAKIRWKKPWVNKYGHSLSASTEISSKEPVLDFTYRIPLARNPLEEYWVFQGGYKHTDLNDTESDSASFSASRWWEYSDGWQRSLRIRGSYDSFTQGEDVHSTLLLYPGITFSRIRKRGGVMPYWGDSQMYSVDFSSESIGSDASFAIFQAQQSWIRTYFENHRFLVRAQAGYIETDDFSRIPPDLRFFAGGDRSVRGYDYKSISPKNSDGTLSGASALLTAGIEYQYNVSGKWWTALFYDIGEAVDHFEKSDFKQGAGVGIRWLSPIGPVKFDLALPINDADENSLHVYVGLGAEI